jgi:S1-C subfamily serine protease
MSLIFLKVPLSGRDMSKFYGVIGAFLFLFYILAVSPIMGQGNLPVLIKKVEPSIVVILTYNKEGKILGQGSGFFVNKEGDVITNSHVLQETSRAVVKTNDGKEYPVEKIVAEDKVGDLIQVSVNIPKETVRPLSIITTMPEVGERIIVIGTPLGLDRTASDGIVSAVREIPEFGKIIQVTAPISPWVKWQSCDQHERGGGRGGYLFYRGRSEPQFCHSWRENSPVGHPSGRNSFGA